MKSVQELNDLKLSELQDLCREFKLKCSGRKQELIDRLCVYYNGQSSSGNVVNSYASSVKDLSSTLPVNPHKITPGIIIPPIAASIPKSKSCICHGTERGVEVSCKNCLANFHRTCINYGTGPVDKFLCAMCKLWKMDPFWSCERVLSNLIVTGASGKRDKVINIPDLAQMRRDNKEIWVRSVLFSDDTDVKQTWPLKFDLTCNRSPTIAIKEPDRHHKRRDETIRISHALHSGDNEFSFQWSSAPDAKLLVAVVVCASKPPAFHFDKIRTQQKCELEDAKSRVASLLSDNKGDADGDVECLDVSQRIKLTCPYTCMRIEVPARGTDCRHLQCFDLEGYLTLTATSQSINRRWQCPCCQLRLTPDSIVVDTLFEQVLQDPANIDREELNLNPDGSFVPAHVRLKKVTDENDDAANKNVSNSSNAVNGEMTSTTPAPASGIFTVDETAIPLNLDSDFDEDGEDDDGEPLSKRMKNNESIVTSNNLNIIDSTLSTENVNNFNKALTDNRSATLGSLNLNHHLHPSLQQNTSSFSLQPSTHSASTTSSSSQFQHHNMTNSSLSNNAVNNSTNKIVQNVAPSPNAVSPTPPPPSSNGLTLITRYTVTMPSKQNLEVGIIDLSDSD